MGCDEERRGIRVVHGRKRGDPFGPMGRDYDKCPRCGAELRTPDDLLHHRSGDACNVLI